MRFGSVCSGIESASVAWHPLGWEAAWLAEVDRAASEVLAFRFPHVTNHGDMTLLAGMVRRREIEAPDALVGGTPCQSFSIAGLRGGLSDARGRLTLAFVDLANAIDEIRIADGKEPVIIVWENVPGALNHADNPLGCFLAALAGDDDALEPGPRPESGRSAAYWTWDKKSGQHRAKWPDAGCAVGPQRAISWVVKDAQYFGLAQRRRRVFVVASAREGFDPAGILLEFEGVRRDSAPSREARQDVAGTLDARTDGGGFPGTDGACAGHDVPCDGRLRRAAVGWPADIAATLNASFGSKQGLEDQHINGGASWFVPHPIAFTAKDYGGVATVNLSPTLRSMGHADSHANGGGQVGVAYSVALRGREGGGTAELGDDVAGCSQASGGGGDKPHVLAPIAYAIQERAVADTNCGPGGKGWRDDDCAFTLEARNKVQAVAVIPFDTTQITSPGNYSSPKAGDPCHPLAAGAHPPAVCVTEPVTHTLKAEGFDASEDGTGRGQPIVPASYATREVAQTITSNYGKQLDNSDTALGPNVAITDMAVRRLMPVECERLQGFPDGWTHVPTSRNRYAADGPRYKQLGNSMAVNVMTWIGNRIASAIRPRGHNGGPPLDDFDSLLADDFEALL